MAKAKKEIRTHVFPMENFSRSEEADSFGVPLGEMAPVPRQLGAVEDIPQRHVSKKQGDLDTAVLKCLCTKVGEMPKCYPRIQNSRHQGHR